jgi:hypothetical protein
MMRHKEKDLATIAEIEQISSENWAIEGVKA